MIRTATEMYDAFLDAIVKEGKPTVFPELFNNLINTAQTLIYDELLQEGEVNQKRIDDLQPFRMISELTDADLFALPPDYYRCQSIRARLRLKEINKLIPYILPANGILTTEKYYMAKPLRTDNKNIISDNPYRRSTLLSRSNKPKVYYEIVGNKIVFTTAEGTNGAITCIVDYYRTPKSIFFDQTGNSHVNCEFRPRIQQMIVDRAVRIYIERTEGVRYQTVFNEDQIKSLSK